MEEKRASTNSLFAGDKFRRGHKGWPYLETCYGTRQRKLPLLSLDANYEKNLQVEARTAACVIRLARAHLHECVFSLHFVAISDRLSFTSNEGADFAATHH